MSLRFFADHCISNFIIHTLREGGYDVFRLREYLPPDSADPAVIAQAQELDALLVSLNGDFANIVLYPPADYKGILALQVRNHPEIIPQLMVRLKDYVSAHSDMGHYKGKLFVVEVHRIGVRE